MRFSFLLSVVLFLSACGGAKKKTTEMIKHPLSDTLDHVFKAWATEGKFNGNILIARGDTLIYKGSFGKAEEVSGRLLNDSTVFELASVSKQFTAMAVLLLREQGKLSLEDSLEKYFTGWPYPGIRIKNLLQHTSGLPDYMDLMMKRTAPGKIANNQDLLQALLEEKPASLFAPGSKWEYSNTGYALLANIVEQVSGKTFRDYMRENIFQPIGMTHSEIFSRRLEKREIPNYAFGYMEPTEGNWLLPDSIPETKEMVTDLDGIAGDGIVNSTILDLWKWSRALDQHQLVPAAVQEQIYTPAVTTDGKEQEYGFGWMISKDSLFGKIVAHSGGWPGYGTYIEKHLEKGYTIILLSNHDRPDVKLKTIRNILYGIQEEKKEVIQLDENLLKEYAGTYEIVPEFSITISVEGKRIFEQATGQGRLELYAEKKDLFFLKEVEASIRFERDAAGKVNGLVLLQNGQEGKGKKVK